MNRVVTRRPDVNTFMDSSSSGLYYVQEEEEVSVDDSKMHQVLRSHVQQPDYEDDQDYRPHQDQSFFERSQNAKRIRREQLENWKRREEQSERMGKDHSKYDGLKQSGSLRHRKAKRKKTVMFEWNVLLMDAVLRDEVLEVDRLLSTFEDLEQSPRTELVNCRSPDGLTPLHQCCIENLEEMAILLIRNGADLRAVDSELWSPLHAAATCGHLRMVRMLVEAVARTQKKSSIDGTDHVREMLLAVNSDGNMPFDLCDNVQTLAFIENEMQQRDVTQNDIEAKRHKKEVDMVRDLQTYLDNYARTNRPGSFRHRNSLSSKNENRQMWESFIASSRMPNAVLMHIAASNGYLEAMDLLLKNKYPVDLEDEDGWLPIHAAVAWNQPEAAKRLVDAGADIIAKVRGTNETALDLAYAADLHGEPGKAETFSDRLILWDTAYRKRCEEETVKKDKSIPRHPSSESVTSAPSSASPLLKRSSPKLSRVQRRSSLKDKEDLIALLHTLGAHDLKSSENNQGSLGLFVRSPGGSLRDRNPVLPTVSEDSVIASSSAIVHVGQGDADLINQTISPELISSLLRSFETADDSADNESIAEQFLRDADEALNQIDHPVTLAQLKKNRNRFRMLKRKEKPFVKEATKSHSIAQAFIDEAKLEQTASCLPLNSPSSRSLTASPRQIDVSVRTNGMTDSTELQRFTATQDERPVGAEGSNSAKLSNSFTKKKKDKMYNITGFRSGKKDNKEPLSDDQKFRPIPSNGCCTIS